MKLRIALVFFSILFISCSSDDSSGSGAEVSKLVKSETVSQTFKVDYSYDANNRLINAFGTHPNFNYAETFTYNPDGRLTQASEQDSGSSTYSDTTNFSYDTQGRLVNYSSGTNVVSLAYNGTIVALSGTIEGEEGAAAMLELNSKGLVTKLTENSQYTIFEYTANGNMTTATSYNINTNNMLMKFTISYDTKINPFYGQLQSAYIERFMEFFWEFDGIYVGGYEGYSFPYFKNNIVSVAKAGEDTPLTTSYTYNSDNYPVTVTGGTPFSIAYY